MGVLKTVPIKILKPHPRNIEFFDDIDGVNWDDFLDSIKESGVLIPLMVTEDYVVVSGNQRIRACKELGIENVDVIISHYDSEDMVIKDLIEINIKQRGIGNPNPVKFGRCIIELERIYGLYRGKHLTNNYNYDTTAKTQKDLANELGLNLQTFHNYKKLASLIPEIEDFLDTGMITQSSALAIVRQLSKDDQESLMYKLDKETKYTQKEIQGYIDEIKKLKENPVVPDDYEELKDEVIKYRKELDSISSNANEYEEIRRKYDEALSRQEDYEREISELKKNQFSPDGQEATEAYEFWKAAEKFTADVLGKMRYSNTIKNNYDNECGEYIINACNIIIEAASDILKRFNVKEDIIDSEEY